MRVWISFQKRCISFDFFRNIKLFFSSLLYLVLKMSNNNFKVDYPCVSVCLIAYQPLGLVSIKFYT